MMNFIRESIQLSSSNVFLQMSLMFKRLKIVTMLDNVQCPLVRIPMVVVVVYWRILNIHCHSIYFTVIYTIIVGAGGS